MRTEARRLNVNLPEDTYRQLKKLADESHRSMTEVVRTALGLVKIALEEERKDNSIAVVDRMGTPIKEIVLAR